MSDKMPGSLMENLITILAYDNECGRIVANLVTPEMFEGEYIEVARRCINYWGLYRCAPGDHTSDLFDDILKDHANRRNRIFRGILTSMLHLSSGMNTRYIMDQLRLFLRLQSLKKAILVSAEKLRSDDQLAMTEVETIWNDLLRTQVEEFDKGLTLADISKVISHMNSLKDEFTFGISLLDKMSIVPYRDSVSLLIGPTGRGKTWFLVAVGRANVLLGKKVCHISLEMTEETVVQRYYQTMFSVPKRKVDLQVPTFSFKDEEAGLYDRRLESIDYVDVVPDFMLSSPHIKDELYAHTGLLRNKVNNLIVKAFPMRSLSASQLRGYLDTLELVHNFIPDVLIIDYVGIMKTSVRDYRIDLGRNFQELKAIGSERNMAVVTAQQANRGGAIGGRVRATDVSEDWSLVHAADQVMSLTSTEAEFRLGLARMFIDKARGESDKFEILLSQNFAIGQFALDAVLMRSNYYDIINELKDDGGISDDD